MVVPESCGIAHLLDLTHFTGGGKKPLVVHRGVGMRSDGEMNTKRGTKGEGNGKGIPVYLSEFLFHSLSYLFGQAELQPDAFETSHPHSVSPF